MLEGVAVEGARGGGGERLYRRDGLENVTSYSTLSTKEPQAISLYHLALGSYADLAVFFNSAWQFGHPGTDRQ